MALIDARTEARLPASDLDRARRWYDDKLGLEPVEERPGGLRYQTGAGVFCLFLSAGTADGTFTQLSFNVDDLRAEVEDLRARGVEFLDYRLPGLATTNGIATVDGNYPSKGTGELGAWFHDSENNLLAIGQALHEPTDSSHEEKR
jgi:catechol 2,3-dioxygenase-like lactoylglutathione lyase family enzyme